MRKLLTILFLLPLFVKAQFNIAHVFINGDSAKRVVVRIISYRPNDSIDVWYGYYNFSNHLIPKAEGNLRLSGSLIASSNDIRTTLENVVGAVSSWQLDIHTLFSTECEFSYTQSGVHKLARIDASLLPADTYTSIRESAYHILGVNSQPAPPTVENVVSDNGTAFNDYNGFPNPAVLADQSIVTTWKRSPTHAATGQLMIARSVDGGLTWTERQVTIGGVNTTCDALNMAVSGNYVILSYQNGATFDHIKFARILQSDLYNNFNTADWTSCGTFNFTAGWTSQGYGQPVTLPGKIYQPYYQIQSSPLKTKIGLLVSRDGGQTWVQGPIVRTSDDAGAFNTYTSVEPFVVITDPTGDTLTTKLVCLSRNYSFSDAYYMHCRSSDGGATWTTDQVNFVYVFGSSDEGEPISMSLHKDSIYIVDGHRALPGNTYHVQFVSIDPTDFFTNVQAAYSAVQVINYEVNADTMGSFLDFGYTMNFEDANGELWCHFYDISNLHNPSETTYRRCWIYQLKVAN